MTFERSDTSRSDTKPSAVASERLRDEVDVINRLVLTNPATTTIPELYGLPSSIPSSEVNNMLNGFGILDVKNFMKGVHGLSDRANAKKVPLNKEFLDQIKNDVQIAPQERGVARVMSENFKGYTGAVDDTPRTRWWGTPERDLVLTDRDIQRMDRAANVIDNSKKHPSMRNASELASTAQSILDKNGGQSLGQTHLHNVVFSPQYTNAEKAAASILAVNFAAFDQMGNKSWGIDREDINALANLGAAKPEDAGAKNESCQKGSVSGNAAAWAVTVGVLSLAAGSKNAMRNAVVAAGSAAAAQGIANSLECQTDR